MQNLRALLFLLAVLSAGAVVYHFATDGSQVGTAGGEGGDQNTEPQQPVRTEYTQEGKSGQASEQREAVTAASTREIAGKMNQLRGRLIFSDRGPAGGLGLRVYQDVIGKGMGLLRAVAALPVTEVATGVTDQAGRFQIEIKAPGKYRFDLVSDEFVLRGVRAGGLSVDLKSATKDLGDVYVERATSIHGQVLAGGRGVEGIEIVVQRAGVSSIVGGVRAKTDSEGAFMIRGVYPGKVVVGTRSSSYLPSEQQLELSSGQEVTGLILELRAGGVITGVVVDDRGVPITGAKVMAARKAELLPGVKFSGFRAGESAVTDESGRFRLAGLAQKTAHLRSTKQGFVEGGSSGVKVGQMDVVLKMNRLAEVHGVLVDTAGDPIPGSTVRARQERRGESLRWGGSSRVVTDKLGKFVLTGVRPGTNHVTASGSHALLPDGPVSRRRALPGPAGTHLEVTEIVEVSPGSVVKGVRLVARKGTVMTVSVVDHEGEPVANADVVVEADADRGGLTREVMLGGELTRKITRRVRKSLGGSANVVELVGGGTGEELGRGRTGDDGIAVIRGLPPGRAVVKAGHKTLALKQPATTQVPDGGEVSCRVRMQLGGYADVSVSDTNGQPLPMTDFQITGPIDGSDGEPDKGSHSTGAEGLAQIGPLRPGGYRAVIVREAKATQLGQGVFFSTGGEKSGLVDSQVQFVIKPGKTEVVRLLLPVLTTVQGTVRDANGVVEGAEVELMADGEIRMPFGGANKSATDAEGRFELTGMQSGKYKLSYGRRGAAVASEVEIELAPNQPIHDQNLAIPGGVVTLISVDEKDGSGVGGASVTLKRNRPKPEGNFSKSTVSRSQVVMVGMTSGSGGGGPSTFTMRSGNQATKTDAKGRAVIRDLPSGRYDLVVAHKDYAEIKRTITLGSDENLDLGLIKMVEGCKIRGTVKWEARPVIALALVELADPEGKNPTIRMAQNGSFKFDGLRPGAYRLRARPVSGSTWLTPQTVQLVAGETERVTLTIPSKK